MFRNFFCIIYLSMSKLGKRSDSMGKNFGILLGGLCAGAINGLLGAGGGLVLIPLLNRFANLNEDDIFPSSVAIIAPICVISFLYGSLHTQFSLFGIFPYLLGSAAGGILAGLCGKRIPTIWLHRILGILILWGGIRYLC